MDTLGNDTEHLFLLPVALILQNELGTSIQDEYGYNTTTPTEAGPNQTGQNWKAKEIALGGPQRLEKIGDIIRKELKWAFILHTYGFGCLFFILAFYTFFSLLNIRCMYIFSSILANIRAGRWRIVQNGKGLRTEYLEKSYATGGLFTCPTIHAWSFISSRPFMSTINGFLCLLGASRATSLFIDPYNLKEELLTVTAEALSMKSKAAGPKESFHTAGNALLFNMPRLFGQVLWDLGFPSIISAFSLVQLAFLQFTQFRVGPEGLRRKSCLSLIVTAHFLLTIAIDIVVASHENLMALKHVVHYVFLSWGIFLCSNFLYSGYKIMSMIKNFPERAFRDFHDASYKGIMQLAMLTPRNNLAGSMTAALLPTLCSPKIHQQDNSNLSFVGFKSDGNSRILESESIPMLEELMGSSADEACSKPLVRASSFQNQKQNFQKLNPKSKSCLKSNAHDSNNEEFPQGKRTGMVSLKPSTPKDHFSKGVPLKTNDSDFSVKPANGVLKRKENFTASTREVKQKLHRRTCFESENACFANKKKKRQTLGTDNLAPEILVSCPGSSETVEPNVTDTRGERNEHTSIDLASELSKDLTEMCIIREDKINRSEEVAEIHNSAGKTCDGERKNNLKNKSEVVRRHSEKRSKSTERSNPSDLSMPEMASVGNAETLIEGPRPKEFTKFEETQPVPRKVRSRRKGKSFPWKKKPENDEEVATRECLLIQEQSTDAALNHMADANRGSANSANCDSGNLEKVRKSKVEWVLNITYITAMWGLMLCLSYMGKIYSSFGLPEPRKTVSRLNPPMHSQDGVPRETPENGTLFSSWPWLWFQTFCRALELAMGCAMANITRQPTADSRYSRSLMSRHEDTFYNI